MSKMKTDSGAKKRIKITGTGKLARRKAFTNHLLEKKSSKRMRRLHEPSQVSKADDKTTRRLLGLR